MLKKIYIQNYKCYKKSTLTLKDITVIVGNNNAGKSTLIEALRLVAYVVNKYKNTTYGDLPIEFSLPKVQKGFKIPTANLMIDLRSAIYNFEGDYAKIEVEFESKERVSIYLNTDYAYACIQDSDKNYITKKSDARRLNITPVRIMPQIGLIKDEEKRISPETIEKGLGTRLSSRHFRNELLQYKEQYYNEFVAMAQNTWSGLRIQNLDAGYGDDPISLYVYDGSFSAEIGSMGSGLQMWLQIIWFLSRCEKDDTIILDEPDVYMHPDMQKKIFDIVVNKFNQVIIATHSVEIISAVDPHYLVTVNRNSRKFYYANDIKGAQSIIDNIGGIQNLSLIRLGNAKKCVFVEGKDLSILSKIHRKLYPDSNVRIDDIPVVPLGGKGRFEEALGTARLFREETNSQIKVVCLLDHDYSTDEEIEKYQTRAKESNLELHIWRKKEIENYIVTPEIVFAASKLPIERKQMLFDELDKELESFKEIVIDQYASNILQLDKSQSITTVNPRAREIVSDKWNALSDKMSLINGKDLIKTVSKVLREKFDVNCRMSDYISAITKDNISSEVLEVLSLLI